MRFDALRFGYHHPALHLFPVGSSQEQSYIVSRPALIQDLVEHFHTGYHGVDDRVLQTDDLDRVSAVDDSALDPSCHHSASALDREHIFDRHHERFVCTPGPVLECIRPPPAAVRECCHIQARQDLRWCSPEQPGRCLSRSGSRLRGSRTQFSSSRSSSSTSSNSSGSPIWSTLFR